MAETKKPKKTGRPTKYTEALADTLCGHIADGKSLVSWCRQEGHATPTTVYRWIRENEDFRNRYEEARADQADTLSDEITDIADTSDELEGAQRSRLRVDARKWVAAKLKPKKYGESREISAEGKNSAGDTYKVTFKVEGASGELDV